MIVEGNFLGTDPTGEFKKGNDGNVVHIYFADNNTVGGTTPQARNILSGNGKYSEQKTGVGLAVLAAEYPEKFEKVRQSLPEYFERGMRVMEMAGKAGKRITEAASRSAVESWEEMRG